MCCLVGKRKRRLPRTSASRPSQHPERPDDSSPPYKEPDVGCGQVQSVWTLGIGVEARADDGEGGKTIVGETTSIWLGFREF
ncbi:hypothetical protein BJV77DRAFT_1151833 [Russula vinacea]|nr:hypothetical protein BJV77DRAFT_1151833 [Russula vinacea]